MIKQGTPIWRIPPAPVACSSMSKVMSEVKYMYVATSSRFPNSWEGQMVVSLKETSNLLLFSKSFCNHV